MGKCKVCGAEILDNEVMCEDCKALDDVDLIKSDDELEALLNSVMHSSPASYQSEDNSNYVDPAQMTIDPMKEAISTDNEDILSQLDNIASNLLDQYSTEEQAIDVNVQIKSNTTVDEENEIKESVSEEKQQEPVLEQDGIMDEQFNNEDIMETERIEHSNIADTEQSQNADTMEAARLDQAETIDVPQSSSVEEETIEKVDASEEEQPIHVETTNDSLDLEEEPFSIDSLSSEEEGSELQSDIDSDFNQEEPFSIDSLTSEEEAGTEENQEDEPFSIDSLTSEEEGMEGSDEEPFSLDSLMSEEEPEASEQEQSQEKSETNNLYDDIPGFEGIFDGIEDNDDKETSDVGDVFADVLGTVSNYGVDKGGKEAEKKPEEIKKKEKKGFGGWFANIENPDAEEEYEKDKQLAEEKAASKAAKKEEKAAKTAEKKAKKTETKKAKAEAKAAKKAEKDAQIEEEAKQEYNKINKKGAAVVLLAFACIGFVVIWGTERFAYSSSINQAEDYFARRKYTKAYNQISGLDVKKADQEIANRIKTVMYVNKEYDSYSNYYTIQYYAEALNSLLNGLTKYDMYIEQASELGVKSDLQYVKSQIVNDLKDKYQLDEKSAKKLTQIEDQEEYSNKVIAIAENLVEKKKK